MVNYILAMWMWSVNDVVWMFLGWIPMAPRKKTNIYVRLQRFSPALPESDVFVCVLERVDHCCGPAQTIISRRFNSFHDSWPAGQAQQFEDVFRCSQHRTRTHEIPPFASCENHSQPAEGSRGLVFPNLSTGAPLRKLALQCITNKETLTVLPNLALFQEV